MTLKVEPTGLFEGLTIIEIGQYVAAPFCGELFAHGGADVISIEPVSGSATRFSPPGAPDGIQFVTKARGKRSVAVDLGSESGRRIVRELCLTGDVVISSLRPGLAQRLRLDYPSLSADRPGIIVAEVDGFGDQGGERGCVDIVAQAASGLLASLALSDRPEVRRDVLLTDVAAGLLLAYGVSSALWFRERTGKGQRVATSMVAAGLALQNRTAHRIEHGDPALMSLVDELAEGADYAAVLQERNDRTNRMYPTYDVFETRTGWVAIGAAHRNAHVLLGAAGLDPAVERLSDPGLKGRLRQALAKQDADDVIADLERGGVPVARVRLLEELLTDDSQIGAGFIAEFEHHRLGRVRLPAAPLRFSAATYRAQPSVPDIGQHTVEVLRDIGLDQVAIEALVDEGVIGVDEKRADAN